MVYLRTDSVSDGISRTWCNYSGVVTGISEFLGLVTRQRKHEAAGWVGGWKGLTATEANFSYGKQFKDHLPHDVGSIGI